MKRNWKSLLMCLALFVGYDGPTAQPQTSGSSGGLTLAATPSAPPFHLGQPMLVTLMMVNTAKQPLHYEIMTPETAYMNFGFSLKQNGEPVPKTAFHRRIRNEQTADDPIVSVSGRILLQTLKPGANVQFVVDLAKLYVITQAGTYSFSADWSDEKGLIDVHSPAIPITVGP